MDLLVNISKEISFRVLFLLLVPLKLKNLAFRKVKYKIFIFREIDFLITLLFFFSLKFKIIFKISMKLKVEDVFSPCNNPFNGIFLSKLSYY